MQNFSWIYCCGNPCLSDLGIFLLKYSDTTKPAWSKYFQIFMAFDSQLFARSKCGFFHVKLVSTDERITYADPELTYLHRQNDHLLSAQVQAALHGQCGLVGKRHKTPIASISCWFFMMAYKYWHFLGMSISPIQPTKHGRIYMDFRCSENYLDNI